MLNKFFLVTIIFLHCFILIKLIFFPYPELFIYPYLTNKGLLPYSQILDQHFPGLMFLPINFDNLGMTNEISARIWLISIVIITHLLLFFISRIILKNDYKALLVNFLYLLWQPFFEGWVLWIDNLLPLLLLPGFLSLYKSRFFITGLLLGLAILFKQTIIPLAFLVLGYIVWKERVKVIRYLVGVGIPITLMLLYFAARGILADFWYWTVIFNLTVYASAGTQIPTSSGFISRVIFVYLVSLSGYFHKEKRLVVILFLFLVGSLLGAFDRANFVHFQPSLPFAVMATILGVYSLKKQAVFILISLYIAVTIWWQNIFYKGHLSNHIFFFDQATYAIAGKIKEYTNPKDKIFVFGAAPHLYQLSQTLPAGDVFVFQFPWFLKVVENRVLDGIKKDQPKIIVSDRTVDIEGEKIIDFANNIYRYIEENYEKIDSVGNTEILRRK